MYKTAFIVSLLLVLINGDETESVECQCVPKIFCEEYINGKDNMIVLFRSQSDATETLSCESELEICCDIDEKIQLPKDDSKENETNIPEECRIRNETAAIFSLVNENLESQFGEFPWMIEISDTIPESEMLSQPVYRYLAGGSLISPSVVLTAAHKVYDKNITTLQIRAGEWDQNSTNESLPHQDRKVIHMVIHDQFHLRTGANSLALLFSDKPFKIQDHINTICLPPPNTSFDNARCVVTGWGSDARSNVKQRVNILKKINVPVVLHEECQRMLRKTQLGHRFRLQSNLLCAGGEEGKGSCDGDSGSPLVCPIPNTVGSLYLAGFDVGGAGGCGLAEEPAIYVKISNYIDWIKNHIAGL